MAFDPTTGKRYLDKDCPVCKGTEEFILSCNCDLKDYSCSNGHHWYMSGDKRIMGRLHSGPFPTEIRPPKISRAPPTGTNPEIANNQSNPTTEPTEPSDTADIVIHPSRFDYCTIC